MPLSDDPEKRANQLANLPNMRGEMPAGAWPPGSTPHLIHGLRSRQVSAERLAPIVAELAEGFPWSQPDGSIPLGFRHAIELTALQVYRVRTCAAYLAEHGDTDSDGNLRPEVEALGRASEHALKALVRLGMTPQSAAALGADLARTASATDQLSDHLASTYGGGTGGPDRAAPDEGDA